MKSTIHTYKKDRKRLEEIADKNKIVKQSELINLIAHGSFDFRESGDKNWFLTFIHEVSWKFPEEFTGRYMLKELDKIVDRYVDIYGEEFLDKNAFVFSVIIIQVGYCLLDPNYDSIW